MPHGQEIHIKRICSDPNQLKTWLNILSDWLVKWGYKQEAIMQEIYCIGAIQCESLFVKYPKQNKTETPTLVLTYHPELRSVYEILRKAHQ